MAGLPVLTDASSGRSDDLRLLAQVIDARGALIAAGMPSREGHLLLVAPYGTGPAGL